MNALGDGLIKLGALKEDLDYHLVRASMVVIFLFFGYQKWFVYEAQVLVPFISNGPLIFWLYPLFGIRGATWFLGVSEWSFCALLFLGFWSTARTSWRTGVSCSSRCARRPCGRSVGWRHPREGAGRKRERGQWMTG